MRFRKSVGLKPAPLGNTIFVSDTGDAVGSPEFILADSIRSARLRMLAASEVLRRRLPIESDDEEAAGAFLILADAIDRLNDLALMIDENRP